MFLKFKLVYSFRRANMHSVVQSGSLCGHCHASDLGMHYVVSCSVGEGMGFTGETWKPEMTRRGGGQDFPDLSVSSETRAYCWPHTVGLCSEDRPTPFPSVTVPFYRLIQKQPL